MPFLELTRPLSAALPVWPGDPPCSLHWHARVRDGDAATVGELRTGLHAGTHAEGPLHVLAEGPSIAELPVERFVGPARVVDATGAAALDLAWAEALLAGGPPVPERLLVRTGCWADPARFPHRFAALTPEAAACLAAAGVRLYGTDAPSVDPFDSASLPAHVALARGGVVIVENLWLDAAPPGDAELIALPLRLEGADASPVRAVLRVGS